MSQPSRYLNPTTLHMYEPHSIHTGRLHCAENNAKQTPVLNAFSAAKRRSCGRVLSVQPTLATPSLGIDGKSGWTQSDHGGGKLSKSPTCAGSKYVGCNNFIDWTTTMTTPAKPMHFAKQKGSAKFVSNLSFPWSHAAPFKELLRNPAGSTLPSHKGWSIS